MAETVTVRIPTALRPHAGDNATLELAGGTVGEVLASLAGSYPALGKRLFKGGDELNRFVNVFVNEQDIRFLGHLQTPLGTGDRVSIVPAIAGG